MSSTFSFGSRACPSTMLCAKSLAADLYKPPTGVVTLRRHCGRVTPAVRTGYDTNEEQSTMRAWLDGGCTGSGHSRRLVLYSRGDGGSVRSKPGYWVRIYDLTQETLPRSLRCHFGSFYDANSVSNTYDLGGTCGGDDRRGSTAKAVAVVRHGRAKFDGHYDRKVGTTTIEG